MGSGRGQNGRVLGDATTRNVCPARSINDAIGHFGRACGEMKKVNCSVAPLGNIDILPCATLLAFDLFDLIQTLSYSGPDPK